MLLRGRPVRVDRLVSCGVRLVPRKIIRLREGGLARDACVRACVRAGVRACVHAYEMNAVKCRQSNQEEGCFEDNSTYSILKNITQEPQTLCCTNEKNEPNCQSNEIACLNNPHPLVTHMNILTPRAPYVARAHVCACVVCVVIHRCTDRRKVPSDTAESSLAASCHRRGEYTNIIRTGEYQYMLMTSCVCFARPVCLQASLELVRHGTRCTSSVEEAMVQLFYEKRMERCFKFLHLKLRMPMAAWDLASFAQMQAAMDSALNCLWPATPAVSAGGAPHQIHPYARRLAAMLLLGALQSQQADLQSWAATQTTQWVQAGLLSPQHHLDDVLPLLVALMCACATPSAVAPALAALRAMAEADCKRGSATPRLPMLFMALQAHKQLAGPALVSAASSAGLGEDVGSADDVRQHGLRAAALVLEVAMEVCTRARPRGRARACVCHTHARCVCVRVRACACCSACGLDHLDDDAHMRI